MEVENVAVGVSDDDDDCDDDDNDYLYGHMRTEEAKASIKDKLLSLIQGPDLFSEIHCFGGNNYIKKMVQMRIDTSQQDISPGFCDCKMF